MEHEEWKEIYEIFYKPMLLYALSLTKNMQDAEDLIQETFIKAFLSYERKGNINGEYLFSFIGSGDSRDA